MIKSPTKLLGIGQIGCFIIDKFREANNHNTFRIATKLNNIDGKKDFILSSQDHPECYENISVSKLKCLKTFSKKDNVFVVLSGFDLETSSVLAILERIKTSKITILYLIPDLKIPNQKLYQHHRMVSSVLQEYTRSGLFERMFFVSFRTLETIVGGIPILTYNDVISSHITATFNMFFDLSQNEPLVCSNDDLPIGSRLSTIGACDLKDEKTADFYELKDVTDISYYFVINNKDLQEKKDLFKDLKNIMDDGKIEKVRTSYAIYGSEYNRNICYYIKSTSITQEITG